jgi:hypothetical protein
VAWMYRTGGETRFSKTLNAPGMHQTESVPLYTAPQPRREVELTANAILNLMPDSIPAEHDGALLEFARAIEAAHGITEAPQPRREPLTDEEIEQCMKQAHTKVQGRNLEHAFARAVIAAYRAKQGEMK